MDGDKLSAFARSYASSLEQLVGSDRAQMETLRAMAARNRGREDLELDVIVALQWFLYAECAVPLRLHLLCLAGRIAKTVPSMLYPLCGPLPAVSFSPVAPAGGNRPNLDQIMEAFLRLPPPGATGQTLTKSWKLFSGCPAGGNRPNLDQIMGTLRRCGCD
jgi:hypothetical protein